MRGAIAIDVQGALAPISEGDPAGGSLFNSPGLARLKGLRAVELQVTQGTSPGAPRPPAWRPVALLAAEILSQESKDLQVACWLADALLRSEGFGGLAAGLELITELHARFWEGLHPLPDPGDEEDPLDGRRKWLRWLGHPSFTLTLATIPLTDEVDGLGPFDLNAFRSARAGSGPPRIAAVDLDRAAAGTAAEVWEGLAEELGACLAALDRLEAVAGPLYGGAPELGLRPLRLALAECQQLVERRRPAVEELEGGGGAGPELPGDTQIAPLSLSRTPGPEGAGGATREVPTSALAAREPGRCPADEARAQLRGGRLLEGLGILQRAFDRSSCARDRFLRRLELAELCVEGQVVDLARPLLVELAQVAEQRGIGDWEGAEVWARLCDAQLAALGVPARLSLNGASSGLFERLCRADIVAAHRHFVNLRQPG